MSNQEFQKAGKVRVSVQKHGGRKYPQLNLMAALGEADFEVGEELEVLAKEGELLIRRKEDEGSE